jgi:mRNA-degrading endonuclease toxin of MazEF toxin-antitoxin module
MQVKFRKGDVFIVNLHQNEKNQNQILGEHMYIVYSNFVTCEHGLNIQVIPITSKNMRGIESHVILPKDLGFDVESVAIIEQIQSIDRNLLQHKILQLPRFIMDKIDRQVGIQMSINRMKNIEHCQKLLDCVLQMDNFANKYSLDEEDKNLRNTLFAELKNFAYQGNIDLNRMIEEKKRGNSNGTGN